MHWLQLGSLRKASFSFYAELSIKGIMQSLALCAVKRKEEVFATSISLLLKEL